jgi:hypothetical protein
LPLGRVNEVHQNTINGRRVGHSPRPVRSTPLGQQVRLATQVSDPIIRTLS